MPSFAELMRPASPYDADGRLIARTPPYWGMDDAERNRMFQANLQKTYDTPAESVPSPIDLGLAVGPSLARGASRLVSRGADKMEDMIAQRGTTPWPDDYLPPLPPPGPLHSTPPPSRFELDAAREAFLANARGRDITMPMRPVRSLPSDELPPLAPSLEPKFNYQQPVPAKPIPAPSFRSALSGKKK